MADKTGAENSVDVSIVDETSGDRTAVKAPSTAAAAADPSLVVGLSPNSPLPPPSQNLATTGNITTLGGSVTLAAQGYNSAAVVVSGTWTGTLALQVSKDGGASYSTINAYVSSAQGSYAGVPSIQPTISANGSYNYTAFGAVSHFRILSTGGSFTGTANITITASVAAGLFKLTNSAIVQFVTASTVNSTSANLASGATFTGSAESTLGVAFIQHQFKCDQTCILYLDQSSDGTNWDYSDSTTIPAGTAIAHSHLASAAFYRHRVTNIGPATSTYLRLGAYLCPMAVEDTQKVSADGKTSFFPDPRNYETGEVVKLSSDTYGNLMVRGPAFTDEGSFNDRFPGTSLQSNVSPGTVTFKNGLNIVSGVGTTSTQGSKGQYVKLTGDADTALTQIQSIDSDTAVTLAAAYPGTSGSGVGIISNWYQAIGTGGSISVGSSICTIASGATNAASTYIFRNVDTPNLQLGAKFNISQRIANQTTQVGFRSVPSGTANSAFFQFTGTSNTSVDCVTTSDTGETQTTTITIPSGGTTASSQFYEVRVTQDKTSYFINRALVAIHTGVAPGAYTAFGVWAGITNGTGASTTNLAIDWVSVANQDIMDCVVYQSDPSKMAMSPHLIAKQSLPAASVLDIPVPAMGDKFGRQVVQLGSVRELRGTANITLTSSVVETTLIAAGGTGVFNDLLMLVVSNTSNNTNTRIDFRDATGGAIIFSLQSPGNSTTGFSIPGTSIPQTTANTVWTAQCATSTNSIRIFAVYEKNQ